MNASRIRILKAGPPMEGPVLYWMSRDQRVHDNWAFIAAFQQASKTNSKLIIVFNLNLNYPLANLRSYDFMLMGLQEVEQTLNSINIPFFVLTGDPVKNLIEFISNYKIASLFVDFDPLIIKRDWKKELISNLDITIYEVDAHNIVPCWLVSEKQEFSAKTFRQKIKPLLDQYLDDFPIIQPQQKAFPFDKIYWKGILEKLKPDSYVKPVHYLKPGYSEGAKNLEKFIQNGLDNYSKHRNDPTQNALSNLSAYLHFGQISAQRIAIEIVKSSTASENKDAFLEELIVRRELSDNYCYYNNNYNNLLGAPAWAIKSLEKHKNDEREFLYELDTFEKAHTHDNLWNAAQNELVNTGKMHGYMRMYWAKKILEWTTTPEKALEIAIYLNDKYSLDGRDPNGYVGCMWAIAGLHDRPWKERPVFGMIRYMNRNGCERKFDVKKYIAMHYSESSSISA